MNFLSRCEDIAKSKFSLQGLRPAQKEVLDLLDKNNFVLATLPTGAGKTFLYAIPSLIYSEGPVLILSPLISLMRDQARRMAEANIPCAIFTSEQSEQERKDAWQKVRSGHVCLIFASPERFVLPSFLNACIKAKLSMVVVDEAHCVMSWGLHFRPEYAEIGKILEKLNPPRILALTATAGKQTREEIIKKVFPLGHAVQEYVSLPLGKHILVESIRLFTLDEQWAKLVESIRCSSSKKIIVYTQSRKSCDEFAKKLRQVKIHSVVYHAGLSKEERQSVESYIHSAEQKIVVCATSAFGMGVDVSGIDLVIVYGYPNNIEELFQMLGRAGRGGQAAHGLLLWTGRDSVKRDFLFKKEFPSPSVLIEKCTNFMPLMPSHEAEKTFVEWDKIRSYFPREPQEEIERLLSALKICQMIETPNLNENYLLIKMKDSCEKILDKLPLGVTKRSKFIEGLSVLVSKSWFSIRHAQIVLSQKLLLDSSELSEESLFSVLDYYSKEGFLSWEKIPKEKLKDGVIFTHSFSQFKKSVGKYIIARNLFFQSFKEMEKLSLATTCRLASSFEFFAATLPKNKRLCHQCDLCIKSIGKVSVKGSFQQKKVISDSFAHFSSYLKDRYQYEQNQNQN